MLSKLSSFISNDNNGQRITTLHPQKSCHMLSKLSSLLSYDNSRQQITTFHPQKSGHMLSKLSSFISYDNSRQQITTCYPQKSCHMLFKLSSYIYKSTTPKTTSPKRQKTSLKTFIERIFKKKHTLIWCVQKKA